jgi:hypothetical protein
MRATKHQSPPANKKGKYNFISKKVDLNPDGKTLQNK